MKPSVKKALLVPQGCVLALVFLALISFTYWRNQAELSEIFGRHLHQIALVVLEENDSVQTPVVFSVTAGKGRSLITQIWNSEGVLLKSTETHKRIPLEDGEGFSQSYIDGGVWLVYRLDDPKKNMIIQVAMPDEALKEITIEGVVQTIVPMLLALIILSVCGWLLTNRALRPLNSLSAEIRHKQQNDLSPVVMAACPAEVQPLVDQLNLLLQRLQDAFVQEKIFIADAAHQLRTPLAALRLQLDVLKGSDSRAESNAAIANLEKGIERNIVLARQLLALARSEDRLKVPGVSVNVMDLVRRAASDLAPLAERKGFDVVVPGVETGAEMTGNPDALYALCYNLIHNAIHYGRQGGMLEVRYTDAGLLFADDGPGIPAEKRARIFDRFYRIENENTGEGSGLGLSIAQRVAENHGATITVTDGLNGAGVGFLIKFS